MEAETPKALFIGEGAQSSSYLAKRLQKHGCVCQFADSCEEAYSVLRVGDFDLVLSPFRLRERSAIGLVAFLEGSLTTLFYAQEVEQGCWWLPALRFGENCLGSVALRSSEFGSVLDETIKEIRRRSFSHLQSGPALRPPLPALRWSGTQDTAPERRGMDWDRRIT
jgi:hypothetical protein